MYQAFGTGKLRPPPGSSRVAWKTRRLLGVARRVPAVSAEKLDELYEKVLAVPADSGDSYYGFSGLNNDGVPLQLCLSSGPQGWDLRLIGDPGAYLGQGEARYLCSTGALRSILKDNRLDLMASLAEECFLAVFPASESDRLLYRDGFIWIAASLSARAIGFYLEAAPLGQKGGWQAVEQLLTRTLPRPDGAIELISHLKQTTTVASIGLEGSDGRDCRIKIYFRLISPGALGELGIALFGSQEIIRFLQIAMDDLGVDRDGLLLCLGLNSSSGEIEDVKIDLCGHCLDHSEGRWIEVVDACAGEFELSPVPLRETLGAGDCKIAFIGFALGREGHPRLNLYLQPTSGGEAPPESELYAAFEDGVEYLCGLQNESGAWTDFRLPVGISDQWVTAYVGRALARAGKMLNHRKALSAARAAAEWLIRDRTYDTGWGFNSITGPDADSTAVCLNLLGELGLTVRPEDRDFLRLHWRAEGGFATYSSPNAWGSAHWDVTPLSYIALAREDRKRHRGDFLRSLDENRMRDGLWRSYWWRNPFYSTLVTLETLSELGIDEPPSETPQPPGQYEIDNAFDLACVIGIELYREAAPEKIDSHLRLLLNWQARDGRWPGHANLRVTDDTCYRPWEGPAGDYYKDEAATITTATALLVLAMRLG